MAGNIDFHARSRIKKSKNSYGRVTVYEVERWTLERVRPTFVPPPIPVTELK